MLYNDVGSIFCIYKYFIIYIYNGTCNVFMYAYMNYLYTMCRSLMCDYKTISRFFRFTTTFFVVFTLNIAEPI